MNKIWKIVIATNTKSIYFPMQSFLENLFFEDRKIRTFDLSKDEQIRNFLQENLDTALLIMEIWPDNLEKKLNLLDYIRHDLFNDRIRIILFSQYYSYISRRKSFFKHGANMYFELMEVSGKNLGYLALSEIKDYKKAMILHKNDIALNRMMDFFAKSSSITSVNEFFKKSFDIMDNLFKTINAGADIAIYLDNSMFISSDVFREYSSKSGKEFLKAFLESNIDTKSRIIWHENNVLCSLECDMKSFIFIRFNCNKAYIRLKKTFSVFFREMITVFESLKLKTENTKMLNEIIFTLAELIESRSEETGEHVQRVRKYTRILCDALNIDREKTNFYEIGSMLHDVGKIGIPDNILNKPGRLTPEEFEIMKRHTIIGFEILNKARDKIFKLSSHIALTHHENWDGSGYPNGLKGEEIPIEGRIVSLADYYDALSSDRVYRKAWEEKRILDSIKELKGIKFDPKIVDAFFNNYDKIIRVRMEFLHKQIGSKKK
jgi:HD-GYP domain-containing protein (c-di-GMP phosphodiesterase class II)